MRKRLLIIILLLFTLFGVAYFFQRLHPPVEVAHPQIGPAVEAVYATGTVEASVMMPIAPRSTARLTQLNADEGENVTQGQALAQLEDEDLQQSIRQLQAKEDYARKEWERNKELFKIAAISKQALEQSQSDLEAARAATAAAKAQAGYLKLLSPADGLIIKRDGEVGQTIPANQPVFWLSCCAPLRISADVDEEDIAQVKPGQAVLIRADAFPGEIFHGRVQAVTPKGDPIARSYRVRIEFKEETPLRIGMTAENNIIIEERKDALLVPSASVTDDAIWRVKEGRLERRKVKTGVKGAEKTEILSGIAADDWVVLNPAAKLKAGAEVRIQQAGQAQP